VKSVTEKTSMLHVVDRSSRFTKETPHFGGTGFASITVCFFHRYLCSLALKQDVSGSSNSLRCYFVQLQELNMKHKAHDPQTMNLSSFSTQFEPV
jgi:hypothetical protein